MGPLHGMKSQHVMRDTALEFGPPSGTGKLIPLLLDAGTSTPANRWDFPTPCTQPHMCYSTGVTNELVRMLGLSDKTPPGLPGLKPSSNSVLPVAWITRPTTDLRQLFMLLIEMIFECCYINKETSEKKDHS